MTQQTQVFSPFVIKGNIFACHDNTTFYDMRKCVSLMLTDEYLFASFEVSIGEIEQMELPLFEDEHTDEQREAIHRLSTYEVQSYLIQKLEETNKL